MLSFHEKERISRFEFQNIINLRVSCEVYQMIRYFKNAELGLEVFNLITHSEFDFVCFFYLYKI